MAAGGERRTGGVTDKRAEHGWASTFSTRPSLTSRKNRKG